MSAMPRKGVIGSRVMSGRPSRRAQRSIRPDVSRAVIVVFDPLDIVLTEIAAGLHFDEFEIDLAGIFRQCRVPLGA